MIYTHLNDDCMAIGCSCMAIECTPLHYLVDYCKTVLSKLSMWYESGSTGLHTVVGYFDICVGRGHFLCSSVRVVHSFNYANAYILMHNLKVHKVRSECMFCMGLCSLLCMARPGFPCIALYILCLSSSLLCFSFSLLWSSFCILCSSFCVLCSSSYTLSSSLCLLCSSFCLLCSSFCLLCSSFWL